MIINLFTQLKIRFALGLNLLIAYIASKVTLTLFYITAAFLRGIFLFMLINVGWVANYIHQIIFNATFNFVTLVFYRFCLVLLVIHVFIITALFICGLFQLIVHVFNIRQRWSSFTSDSQYLKKQLKEEQLHFVFLRLFSGNMFFVVKHGFMPLVITIYFNFLNIIIYRPLLMLQIQIWSIVIVLISAFFIIFRMRWEITNYANSTLFLTWTQYQIWCLRSVRYVGSFGWFMVGWPYAELKYSRFYFWLRCKLSSIFANLAQFAKISHQLIPLSDENHYNATISQKDLGDEYIGYLITKMNYNHKGEFNSIKLALLARFDYGFEYEINVAVPRIRMPATIFTHFLDPSAIEVIDPHAFNSIGWLTFSIEGLIKQNFITGPLKSQIYAGVEFPVASILYSRFSFPRPPIAKIGCIETFEIPNTKIIGATSVTYLHRIDPYPFMREHGIAARISAHRIIQTPVCKVNLEIFGNLAHGLSSNHHLHATRTEFGVGITFFGE